MPSTPCFLPAGPHALFVGAFVPSDIGPDTTEQEINDFLVEVEPVIGWAIQSSTSGEATALASLTPYPITPKGILTERWRKFYGSERSQARQRAWGNAREIRDNKAADAGRAEGEDTP